MLLDSSAAFGVLLSRLEHQAPIKTTSDEVHASPAEVSLYLWETVLLQHHLSLYEYLKVYSEPTSFFHCVYYLFANVCVLIRLNSRDPWEPELNCLSD